MFANCYFKYCLTSVHAFYICVAQIKNTKLNLDNISDLLSMEMKSGPQCFLLLSSLGPHPGTDQRKRPPKNLISAPESPVTC